MRLPRLGPSPPARRRPAGLCSAPGSHLKFSARRPRRGVGRAAARVPWRPAGPGEDATRGCRPAPPPERPARSRPRGPAGSSTRIEGHPPVPPGPRRPECAGSAAAAAEGGRERGGEAGRREGWGAGRGVRAAAGSAGARGPAWRVRAAQRQASALGCTARRRLPPEPARAARAERLEAGRPLPPSRGPRPPAPGSPRLLGLGLRALRRAGLLGSCASPGPAGRGPLARCPGSNAPHDPAPLPWAPRGRVLCLPEVPVSRCPWASRATAGQGLRALAVNFLGRHVPRQVPFLQVPGVR